MTSFVKAAALAVFGICGSTAVSASTLEQLYEVGSVTSERAGRDVALSLYSGSIDNPNYWLTDDVRGVFHIQDAGTFRELSDGRWELTSRVVADDWAALGEASGFDLNLQFNDIIDFAYEFKSEDGSTPHGNEVYINLTHGSLTGYGALEGLDLSVTRSPVDGPYATQIGGGLQDTVGANNHNADFGLAGWFFVDQVTSSTCDICAGNTAILNLAGGDANTTLTPVAPVPLPAAGFVLLAALGGLGFVRKRG